MFHSFFIKIVKFIKLNIIENKGKSLLFIWLFLAIYSAQLQAANNKVVTESVTPHQHSESLHYYGFVKSKGVYDIVALASGIVSGLSSSMTGVRSDQPLMRIRPIDPSYSEVNIFTRLERASLYRKLVENGSFVKEQQLLMEVTVDPYFVVALSRVYSEVPTANSALHHFEVRINCSSDLGCPDKDLSESFAKIVLLSPTEKRITTSKNALFNADNQVYTVNSEGGLELKNGQAGGVG